MRTNMNKIMKLVNRLAALVLIAVMVVSTPITAHAEMQAITSASNVLGGKYLTNCTVYVTVEPCVMCAGAIGWSQISRIVYGATDNKKGYHILSPNAFHPKATVVSGILENECSELMTSFFSERRR